MPEEYIHKRMGVAADATGRTVIDHLGELWPGNDLSGVKAVRVEVEQTGAADAQFNIELGGSDIFGSEQSVGSADTPEPLSPDQNRYASDETDQLALSVSTASGTASSVLHITVTLIPA